MTADIEIVAATMWDNEQVARWAALENTTRIVTTIFGCKREQIVGHGRAPGDVPAVRDDDIIGHAAKAQSLGLNFLYLLNGRCEHLDFSQPLVQRQVLEEVDWIVNSVRANGVVIADFRLASLVRSVYPAHILKVVVSTIAGVRTMADLEPWLPLQIEGVVLHHDVARDFSAIRRLVKQLREKAPDVELELLLNESCLHGCASREKHYARLASATMGYIEGFQQNCNLLKFQDPSLVLAADWIRPEDLSFYREIGIRRFKIAGREMSASWLDRTVTAFVTGQFNGNLIELLTMTPPGLFVKSPEVFFLDNGSLTGFLHRLIAYAGSRDTFYKNLASKLWQSGALRVEDPGGFYGLRSSAPRCINPGMHHERLRCLQSYSDPAYCGRKMVLHETT